MARRSKGRPIDGILLLIKVPIGGSNLEDGQADRMNDGIVGIDQLERVCIIFQIPQFVSKVCG